MTQALFSRLLNLSPRPRSQSWHAGLDHRLLSHMFPFQIGFSATQYNIKNGMWASVDAYGYGSVLQIAHLSYCNRSTAVLVVFLQQVSPSPWFEFLVFFYFFAPWYRKSRDASFVKISLKIFKGKVGQMCHQSCSLALGFLYKAVHKIGRLRKFNRAREIEFNFFIAWTIFMKLGTLVHHVHGYKMLPQFF